MNVSSQIVASICGRCSVMLEIEVSWSHNFSCIFETWPIHEGRTPTNNKNTICADPTTGPSRNMALVLPLPRDYANDWRVVVTKFEWK